MAPNHEIVITNGNLFESPESSAYHDYFIDFLNACQWVNIALLGFLTGLIVGKFFLNGT